MIAYPTGNIKRKTSTEDNWNLMKVQVQVTESHHPGLSPQKILSLVSNISDQITVDSINLQRISFIFVG